MNQPAKKITFKDLKLLPQLLKALDDVGYEVPTPIQQETIPYLMEGRDLLGQAQTGTGKTAAFALPLLSRLDLKLVTPQVLVLVPTRELAIQVAEAFQRYAVNLRNFHVLPIYGGAPMHVQLRSLRRGVHVVVATPGRVMDHMRRGTLNLKTIKALVLDEADEMLRMGFLNDVKWILEKSPPKRQIALFSATLPQVIRKVAQKYLHKPKEITIHVKAQSTNTIRQHFCFAEDFQKLDVLTRILETEAVGGILVFVRTKRNTLKLSRKLEARGYASAALNGDIPQRKREQTVDRFKRERLDIIVATDVAARGLDVPRITHVINYDIPYDTEAYVHRIGRTGRAGRQGDAILFVSSRERNMLRSIERATKQKIMQLKFSSKEMPKPKKRPA